MSLLMLSDGHSIEPMLPGRSVEVGNNQVEEDGLELELLQEGTY